MGLESHIITDHFRHNKDSNNRLKAVIIIPFNLRIVRPTTDLEKRINHSTTMIFFTPRSFRIGPNPRCQLIFGYVEK